jgi:hypothetical protein
MITLAAMTVRAGASQSTGKRGGLVRQLVSAATTCLCPANHCSVVLAAAIRARARQKHPRSAATSTSRMILASHHDP